MKEWCNDTKSHWISLCISSCLIQIRVGNALNNKKLFTGGAKVCTHYCLLELGVKNLYQSQLLIYFFNALWYGIKALCKWEDWLLLTLVDPYKQTISIKSSQKRSKGKQLCKTTDEVTWISPIIYRHLKGNETPVAWIIFISFQFLKPLRHHRNGWNCFLTRAYSQLRFKCRQIESV